MSIPSALAAYFNRLTEADHDVRCALDLGLLRAPDVLRLTETFGFHPLVRDLSGFVLDDANTSNHHVLASASPLSGMVVFLSHDGDSRAVFSSIDEFLEATRDARRRAVSLVDLHRRISPSAPDQQALSAFIDALLDDANEHEIEPFVPSLDFTDRALLAKLADADPFLADTIAIELAKRR